ncbi:1293_t:CDS:2, partial [Funneliformis caledonium]
NPDRSRLDGDGLIRVSVEIWDSEGVFEDLVDLLLFVVRLTPIVAAAKHA